MDTLLVVIAVLCALVGIAGGILPVLPGPPISFLALLLMRWSGASGFSDRFLLLWAVVTIVVTVLDYWLPAWFTRKFGGSKYGTRGSVVGLIAGIFFFPPVGMIVGPFLGALFGELLYDRQNSTRAFRVAMGSFVAFVVGTGAKLAASGVMAYYVIRALFV